MDSEAFWKIRSANYDKLYWTKDVDYLSAIVKAGALEEHHLVLDVGTGTGTVASAVKEHVRHVVGVDISSAMLEQGEWAGYSVVQWDIGESLFADATFHRVFARMVFHHVIDNLDRALIRCFDLLRDGGKIIVAEGVPPEDDQEVVEWYTEMFRLKEERRTFTPGMLVHYLEKNGFEDVTTHIHYSDDFSIGNWLSNSGLDQPIQDQVMKMHLDAPPAIKEAYRMRVLDGDCLVRTKNVIVVGGK